MKQNTSSNLLLPALAKNKTYANKNTSSTSVSCVNFSTQSFTKN